MSEEQENDMYMDDTTWDNRIAKILKWIKDHAELRKSDEDVADSVDIMRMNIKRGNKRSANRKKYWSSILLEGRHLPDWPIQKGKESNLPQHVQDSLKLMGAEVTEVYTTFWNDNPLIQQIAVVSDRNKDEGGSPYADAGTFAKGRVLATRQRFTKYFTGGRWDGNFDLESGFDISPPPVEEGAETTDEIGDSSDD